MFEIDSLVHVCHAKSERMKITNQFEWSCILGMCNYQLFMSQLMR